MGMSKAEEKILEEVKFYKDRYFTYDEPVPFCGLLLYPVSVRNYNEFLTSNTCFLLNKNDDPKGIAMSHLDYLYSKMSEEEEGKIWSFKFSRLIELIFHIKNGLKCPHCGKFLSYEDFIKIYENVQEEDLPQDILKCDCGDHYREQIVIKKNEKTKKNSLWIDGVEINAKDF